MTGFEFAPIVFGLSSAACWGAADFCGGLATKRAQVYRVIISSQLVSLILLLALALLTREAALPFDWLLWGYVAGMFGAIGLIALYRSLADSHMGVAAPVSAVVAAAVPVVFGVFLEGFPGAPQLVGFGLAFIAVWLISRASHTSVQWHDLGLPFLAGLGFGIFFVIIGGVGASAVWWPLIAARFGSLSMLLGLTLIKRQAQVVARPLLTLAVIIGVLEVGGNACYILARQAGRLDVAAVLASLYPATTVLLARFVLKEHLGRSQLAGLVAALAAIVLITL
jgi:drug/metabolite transporter (DMT)-like permease